MENKCNVVYVATKYYCSALKSKKDILTKTFNILPIFIGA